MDMVRGEAREKVREKVREKAMAQEMARKKDVKERETALVITTVMVLDRKEKIAQGMIVMVLVNANKIREIEKCLELLRNLCCTISVSEEYAKVIVQTPKK